MPKLNRVITFMREVAGEARLFYESIWPLNLRFLSVNSF